MKKNIIISFFCLLGLYSFSQTSYKLESQIIIDDKAYSNIEPIKIGYDEDFDIEIRVNNINDNIKAHINCYVKEIEFIISNGDKVHSKKIQLQPNSSLKKYPFNIKKELIEDAKLTDWGINNFNVNDLSLIIKVTYRIPTEIINENECSGFAVALNTERQQDIFKIDVEHFGTYVLFDFENSAANNGGKVLDFFSGIFNSLEMSSVDYPIVFGKSEFVQGMFSAPIISFKRRSGFLNHIDLQAVLIKNLENNDNLATGFGIGLLSVKSGPKLFKIGAFFQENDAGKTEPQFFISISLRSLGKLPNVF